MHFHWLGLLHDVFMNCEQICTWISSCRVMNVTYNSDVILRTFACWCMPINFVILCHLHTSPLRDQQMRRWILHLHICQWPCCTWKNRGRERKKLFRCSDAGHFKREGRVFLPLFVGYGRDRNQQGITWKDVTNEVSAVSSVQWSIRQVKQKMFLC